MWNWGKSVAEHAAAAAWTTWPPAETRPTIVDPPSWGSEPGITGPSADK
ncbi:hypothetical protein [Nocardia sp. MH4]|nr:hypothetical protein [Nocardia sp. MH4]